MPSKSGTLNSIQHSSEPVEYWFSYELESSFDRVNSFHDSRNFVIDKNQYRFSFGRTDKQELDQSEGSRIVELWEYLLGFCSGTFRTVDIIIGYNDAGGWSYAKVPRPLAKQFSCKFSWFPQRWPMDFPAFARQFLSHFQHDYDRRSGTGAYLPISTTQLFPFVKDWVRRPQFSMVISGQQPWSCHTTRSTPHSPSLNP